MKKIRNIAIVLICLISGVLFFLIQNKWLIIHWSFNQTQKTIESNLTGSATQQKIRLYFWKNEKFQHEDVIIIWNIENKPDTLKRLVDAWLDTLNDEKIFNKKVKTESIALSESEQDAYISFDQLFPWQEWSINQKWLTIESLLKTIKESKLGIKYINLLVHDKPLEDSHLSFIQSWPIEGFKE